MKTKILFQIFTGVLFLVGGSIVYTLWPRITITELATHNALGKNFVNPMYWAAVDNLQDNTMPCAFGTQSNLQQIINIGSIIHFQNSDFRDNHKVFHFIGKNQQWKVEKVFHVEGNKYGLWIDNRPNYNELIIKNNLSNQIYRILSCMVEDILNHEEHYKRVEDYEKLAAILDSQNDHLLRINVVLEGFKKANAIKLSDNEKERKQQVAQIQEDFMHQLTPDLRKFIRQRDPYHPCLRFEIDRDNFLSLYSERFSWKTAVRFVTIIS